jgi:hypothetical protein
LSDATVRGIRRHLGDATISNATGGVVRQIRRGGWVDLGGCERRADRGGAMFRIAMVAPTGAV